MFIQDISSFLYRGATLKELLKSAYFKFGLTAFLSGGALILLYEAINNWDSVGIGWSTIYTIVSPFIYGLVISYLLCPI
jgi:hypothetical protein